MNKAMGDLEPVIVNVATALADVDQKQWDACANPVPHKENPFVSYAFLKALEDSDCVGEQAGWLPCHLIHKDQAGEISACMPCYLKTNSEGEYVFDYAWADAFESAGGTYYPKFQCAVPFTPVPGPRLLVRPGTNESERERILAYAAAELTQKYEASSLHITFLEEETWTRLGTLGFLQRTDQQFHWHNENFQSFDNFLQRLASRKRKAIRKERQTAIKNDISIEHVIGSDITEAHWDMLYEFYLETGSRKWGRPYLNRKFFSLLGGAMANRCLLVLAKRDGRHVAGALHIIGGDCLFGRYWGAIEHHPCLHFEICYYQAIDYCIANGLARSESGAQGQHKIARGFMPTPTYSVHWIANPRFRDAVARYLVEERRQVAYAQQVLTNQGPFKKA